MAEKEQTLQGRGAVRVWDLPTRIFHWLLVTLVAASFATGTAGGTAKIYH